MSNDIAPFSPLMFFVGLAVLLAVRVVYGEARLGGGDLVHLTMRAIGWVLVAMGLLALLEMLLSLVFGVLFWIVMMIGLGTMIARYRRSERSALLWVLAVAAERQMPLVPAVEAFAHEWGGPFGRRQLSTNDTVFVHGQRRVGRARRSPRARTSCASGRRSTR